LILGAVIMTVFYFTATGNSLSVAKRIGGTLISIPLVIDSYNLHFSDDAIGVVFPVHWWNLPIMVRRFIDKASFEADYFFAIGTCGSLAGGEMVSLRNLAKKNGYCFDYAGHLLMLDNYLPAYDMGAQIEKLPRKLVAERIDKIVADINRRETVKAKANFGKRALTAIMGHVFKPGNNAKKYIVSGKCNRCGVCAQVCPANNIAVAENVSFCGHCEGCLACLHLCPQNALHLNNEKSDRRWRNPEVSLKEIIEANNRQR